MAQVAKEQNYVQPMVTNSNAILIKCGRHPLQELCVSVFVPNDTKNGREFSRVKLLTGPNACGKSIYLKQVALIVYMTQIGSFIPAEAAEIGVVHSIYSRIKTLDSISGGMSTFMVDLNQMSLALRNANEHSLVIVDEFGKGTDTVDGIALLAACLRFWLKMGDKCPHLFVSTHFHSVVDLVPRSENVSLQTLEILDNDNEIVYLYQLIDGMVSQSFACQVAKQSGLPDAVIMRAEEVTAAVYANEPLTSAGEQYETHLKRCRKIVKMCLESELSEENLEKFLKKFVLPVSEGEMDSPRHDPNEQSEAPF